MVTIATVTLLIIFMNMKPFYNGIINRLSATTLGIYLIHDNKDMRDFLWTKVFNIHEIAEKNIVYVILSIALTICKCIFNSVVNIFIGAIIERARIQLVEKPIAHSKLLNKLFEKINSMLKLLGIYEYAFNYIRKKLLYAPEKSLIRQYRR